MTTGTSTSTFIAEHAIEERRGWINYPGVPMDIRPTSTGPLDSTPTARAPLGTRRGRTDGDRAR